MKKVVQAIKFLLPHLLNILALMFITFFIIDRHNSAMEFINNDISKALIFVWAILTIIESYIIICKRGKK